MTDGRVHDVASLASFVEGRLATAGRVAAGLAAAACSGRWPVAGSTPRPRPGSRRPRCGPRPGARAGNCCGPRPTPGRCGGASPSPHHAVAVGVVVGRGRPGAGRRRPVGRLRRGHDARHAGVRLLGPRPVRGVGPGGGPGHRHRRGGGRGGRVRRRRRLPGGAAVPGGAPARPGRRGPRPAEVRLFAQDTSTTRIAPSSEGRACASASAGRWAAARPPWWRPCAGRSATSCELAVVTNDIYTEEDAEFLRRAGVLDDDRIVAVQTGCCPHTAIRDDISANLEAVEDLEARHSPLDLVLVESGGDNLTATFSRGLVDRQIFVIDVAGGDKVPRKGGPGVTSADLLVVNKTDLAAMVGADLGVMERDAVAKRGTGPVLFSSLVEDPGASGTPPTGCGGSWRPGGPPVRHGVIARGRVVVEVDGGGRSRLACLRSEGPLVLRPTPGAVVHLVGGGGRADGRRRAADRDRGGAGRRADPADGGGGGGPARSGLGPSPSVIEIDARWARVASCGGCRSRRWPPPGATTGPGLGSRSGPAAACCGGRRWCGAATGRREGRCRAGCRSTWTAGRSCGTRSTSVRARWEARRRRWVPVRRVAAGRGPGLDGRRTAGAGRPRGGRGRGRGRPAVGRTRGPGRGPRARRPGPAPPARRRRRHPRLTGPCRVEASAARLATRPPRNS